MTVSTKDILRSFVIGSSLAVFGVFYIAVIAIPDVNPDLTIYPVIAALYFGLANVLSLFLGDIFGLNLFQRLLLITFLSVVAVSLYISIRKAYDWKDPGRWIQQYLLIAIGHCFAFLFIIYNLEKILK